MAQVVQTWRAPMERNAFSQSIECLANGAGRQTISLFRNEEILSERKPLLSTSIISP
jgi:hypothetical protein